ncbi:MAG: ATP-binding protein [Anaerolineae bacterium]
MANERILVVDDEEGVVKACVRTLERRCFATVGLTDSYQARDYLQREVFDLLLTDIRMPGIDGLKLLTDAKAIDPHLSVVLFTGYGTMDDAIKAMRLGAQGFVLKPFDPDELVAVVEESLQRRSLLRDRVRLQTLLPLLEISKAIQTADGAVAMMGQALKVAQSETGAARIRLMLKPDPDSNFQQLIEIVSIPDNRSRLPSTVLRQVLKTARPAWITANGALRQDEAVARQAVAICLPLVTKNRILGLLTAETAVSAPPFGYLALDVLTILGGQLAIAVENINLFERVESLRTFNENIIENMTNGLIALDLSGSVTAFNRAAAELIGLSSEAVVGQPVDVISPQSGELVEAFRQTLDHRLPSVHREVTINRDGKPTPASASVSLLRDGSNAVAGVVGLVEDLTELKALEAERRRLDRLAALGEMSAVVAHEIRNPIAAVAAGVKYITRHMGEELPDSKGVQMILDEIDRINRILEDILFVARPLHLNLEALALPALIDDVISRYRSQIEKSNICLKTEYQDNLPRVQGDRTRLEQVFTNLLMNTIQAMPEGGDINLQVTASGSKVYVSMQDSGPGIPSDVLPRIFEPFFTTKAKGTGLGLTVAHRVIEEHNGSIKADSAQGHGTTFLIALPSDRTHTYEP